jgi:hypothetical protein
MSRDENAAEVRRVKLTLAAVRALQEAETTVRALQTKEPVRARHRSAP